MTSIASLIHMILIHQLVPGRTRCLVHISTRRKDQLEIIKHSLTFFDITSKIKFFKWQGKKLLIQSNWNNRSIDLYKLKTFQAKKKSSWKMLAFFQHVWSSTDFKSKQLTPEPRLCNSSKSCNAIACFNSLTLIQFHFLHCLLYGKHVLNINHLIKRS